MCKLCNLIESEEKSNKIYYEDDKFLVCLPKYNKEFLLMSKKHEKELNYQDRMKLEEIMNKICDDKKSGLNIRLDLSGENVDHFHCYIFLMAEKYEKNN